jgi:membrane protease YdiL (CAAX protease family)
MLRLTGLRTYFALTFGCAWIFWILAHPVVQEHLGVCLSAALLVVLGTAVPSLVALGLSLRCGAGRELLVGLVKWRVHVRWYVLALAGPPILMLTATAIHVWLGGEWPNYPEAGRWPLFVLNFFAVLVLGGPLGEELGWRGFALPRMQPRFGFVGASALLGIVWAVWHIPLFLTAVSPQAQLPFIWFGLQAVALSLVFSVVWQRTGRSLLLPVLLHASVNAFAGPLRILPAEAGSVRPYVLTVVLTWCLALALTRTREVKPRR